MVSDSWFLYVPVHELLHAAGCLLSGGTVSRLEIAPQYGAALLQKFFPFVAVGSDYAGRLSGFDTHGSDMIYFVTVFCPYLLTLLIGVPLLQSCRRKTVYRGQLSLKIGIALPMAYAPFISLSGDYYEMGAIIVTRFVRDTVSYQIERWRSDDLFALVSHLFFDNGAGHYSDALIISSAFVLGFLLAFFSYWLGALIGKIFFKTTI